MLLEVKDLSVYYPIKGGFFNKVVDYVKAVDGVSFSIEEGMSYGIIGESGSGKTTIGKSIIGLEKIKSGKIFYKGQPLFVHGHLNHQLRQEVQMIFQDSLSSLNPRKKIIDIIAEPLKNFTSLNKEEQKEAVIELLKIVGLDEGALYKYPHQFSGGQRQRIGVARAVASKPKLIIADEPVSALDLSVQAQVLNYMKAIQKKYHISFVFISHDLSVVHYMCDYIAIMHHGRFVEMGTVDDIYQYPTHIYTKRLLSAIPSHDVNHRKIRQQQRQAIEKEYQNKEKTYYDSDGKSYPLQALSATHFVAFNKEGEN